VERVFMEILENAQKMLEKYPLCNHCLGRQVALLGYELDNQKRGEALKVLLAMKGHQLIPVKKRKGISLLQTLAGNGSYNVAAELLKKMMKKVGTKRDCYLCEEQFRSVHELTAKSIEKLTYYEHKNFLVGIKLPVAVEEREDEFKAEFNVKHGENMRNEFSREIGKEISKVTEKEVDYKTPDIVVIINPFTKQVILQVNPLHIAGRYKKLIRGIPQSKWLCRECGGKGCIKCNWSGKTYSESVEEIIATPTLEKTQGEDALFHAAGREDVDARMLGHGRPYVLEIKKPRKRFIDLQDLMQIINKQAQGKVKVLNLRFTLKDEIRKLKKGEAAEKTYKVLIEFNSNVSDEEIEILEKTFSNAVIHQRTPLRVLHRRADRIREKYIYETKIKRLTLNRVELMVRCQGGLYIKELITGDEGRTDPNVTTISGVKANPLELDVIGIDMKGFEK
jgi:tRNA pseudouridine synthase 10